jgi:hypothetical protein
MSSTSSLTLPMHILVQWASQGFREASLLKYVLRKKLSSFLVSKVLKSSIQRQNLHHISIKLLENK